MAADSGARRFPRAVAPVLYRPSGLTITHNPRRVTDLSLGGMRVYTDDRVSPGDRLDLSLFLPNGEEIKCSGRVIWVTPLPDRDPAAFDVGIAFVRLKEQDIPRLASVLSRSSGADPPADSKP